MKDEMNGVIKALKPYEYKISCVLNKADGVSQDELLRVYGALMYNLGKSLDLPEVPRVYVGSFWEQPGKSQFYRELFEAEEASLFDDLSQLPKSSSIGKVNDLLQRGKRLYAHCKVIERLKKELKGAVFDRVKESRKQKFATRINAVIREISDEAEIPLCDFPPAAEYKSSIARIDPKSFNKVTERSLEALKTAIAIKIPKILGVLSNYRTGVGSSTKEIANSPSAESETGESEDGDKRSKE